MTAYREIRPADVHPHLDAYHVIDVRAEHEFRGPLGRIPGARLVPLLELEGAVDRLPRDRTWLLVCRSGGRSGIACTKLLEHGIEDVVNLEGGMIAWQRANLPAELDTPRTLEALVDAMARWVAQVRSLSVEEVRARFDEHLERAEHHSTALTHAEVADLLDFIENALFAEERDAQHARTTPPDLDLSIACFRRWLAAL